MYNFMMEHEAYINKLLTSKEEQAWERIKEYHYAQIVFLQHERGIHLIITLAFALLFVISFAAVLLVEGLLFILLSLILIIVEVFYILYYYRLENGVQRWYGLYNQIMDRIIVWDKNSKRDLK